jgi:hypothetical protein
LFEQRKLGLCLGPFKDCDHKFKFYFENVHIVLNGVEQMFDGPLQHALSHTSISEIHYFRIRVLKCCGPGGLVNEIGGYVKNLYKQQS